MPQLLVKARVWQEGQEHAALIEESRDRSGSNAVAVMLGEVNSAGRRAP